MPRILCQLFSKEHRVTRQRRCKVLTNSQGRRQCSFLCMFTWDQQWRYRASNPAGNGRQLRMHMVKQMRAAKSPGQVTPALHHHTKKCFTHNQLCAFRLHPGLFITSTQKSYVTSCSMMPLCCWAQPMKRVCFVGENLCM